MELSSEYNLNLNHSNILQKLFLQDYKYELFESATSALMNNPE